MSSVFGSGVRAGDERGVFGAVLRSDFCGETDACVCSEYCYNSFRMSDEPQYIILQKGGRFYLVIREQWLTYESLKCLHPEWKFDIEKCMQEMEKSHIWKLIARKVVQNYIKDQRGVIFCYEKL